MSDSLACRLPIRSIMFFQKLVLVAHKQLLCGLRHDNGGACQAAGVTRPCTSSEPECPEHRKLIKSGVPRLFNTDQGRGLDPGVIKSPILLWKLRERALAAPECLRPSTKKRINEKSRPTSGRLHVITKRGCASVTETGKVWWAAFATHRSWFRSLRQILPTRPVDSADGLGGVSFDATGWVFPKPTAVIEAPGIPCSAR